MNRLSKRLDEVTAQDLRLNPVWKFTGNVMSEDTVEAVSSPTEMEDDAVIVCAEFTDNLGFNYLGYIHWGIPQTIEVVRPVMYLEESGKLAISFWVGMAPPREWMNPFRDILKPASFPIRFRSVSSLGLGLIEGRLDGIYNWGDKKAMCFPP
jgi:hypothetical protein